MAPKVTHDVREHTAQIHGNRSLAQRKDALGGFKSGKYRVVVTDIAAWNRRHHIELVINTTFQIKQRNTFTESVAPGELDFLAKQFPLQHQTSVVIFE